MQDNLGDKHESIYSHITDMEAHGHLEAPVVQGFLASVQRASGAFVR